MRAGVERVWLDVRDKASKRLLVESLRAKGMWKVVNDRESADAILLVVSRGSEHYAVRVVGRRSHAPLFVSCEDANACSYLNSLGAHLWRMRKEWEEARSKVQ